MQISGGMNFNGGMSVIVPVAPGAPTIGTATVVNLTTVNVTFTAPADNGGSPITSYTAVSSPGNITGTVNQAGSGTITVTGLTAGTTYTFVVYATNSAGNSANSSASNSVNTVATGQSAYTTAGTYTWTAPEGVTRVSVVAVGPGGWGFGLAFNPTKGGGGGGLGYKNNITVVPGNSYTVVVGGGSAYGGTDSYFINTSTVRGGAGENGGYPNGAGGTGGTYTGDGGGVGGVGGTGFNTAGGGGGAGGYSGTGGNGGTTNGDARNGTNGTGGAGGGGGLGPTANLGSGGGGGVGLNGEGSSGAGGAGTPDYLRVGTPGGGGSGGDAGANPRGGNYGGGAGLICDYGWHAAANGAVRIIWPGTTRQFPSTNTADQ